MIRIISTERKSELGRIISQEEEYWTHTYRKLGNLHAEKEVSFRDEPACLCFGDTPYILDHVTLEAERADGVYHVMVRHPEGLRARLRDVVHDSAITSECDAALCVGLGLLNADLSLQMMKIIDEGPSSNPFMNALFWLP